MTQLKFYNYYMKSDWYCTLKAAEVNRVWTWISFQAVFVFVVFKELPGYKLKASGKLDCSYAAS